MPDEREVTVTADPSEQLQRVQEQLRQVQRQLDLRQREQARRQEQLAKLLELESEFTARVNRGLPREDVCAPLLGALVDAGYAPGMLLTLRVWEQAELALLAEELRNVGIGWQDFRASGQLNEVHAGRLASWAIRGDNRATAAQCHAVCLSTSAPGLVALTAVDGGTREELLALQRALSPAVENLLIRDSILAPGVLNDMATMTREKLAEVEAALDAVGAQGAESAERLASQFSLAMRIRELCCYTHIDKGLAEVSSALLVVTRNAGSEPLTQSNLDAIRGALHGMRKIALSTADADAHIDRLEESGLSIYGAFGEGGPATDDA